MSRQGCLGNNGINSLSPGTNCRNLSSVFFKLILLIDIMSTSCEIGLRWMPQISIHYESTLVQVMTWCRQATSHYLGQCIPRSVSSYGVTRPQWVTILLYSSGNVLSPGHDGARQLPIIMLTYCQKCFGHSPEERLINLIRNMCSANTPPNVSGAK